MPCPPSDDDRLPGIILPSETDSDVNLQVTPLMVAAYHGDIQKVSMLLQKDSQSIFVRNIYDQSPLGYAIDVGHIKVIDLLLAHGVDIDDVDSSGGSILHRCINHGSISKVETCLNIGVNMDITNSNGDTPLIIAAKNGLEDIVQLLITSGCDTSIQNREGLNALEQSFCSNHTAVQLILSDERERYKIHSWQTEMLQACAAGNEHQMQHFIQKFGTTAINFRHKMFQCQTPLLVACRFRNFRCCEILREKGAYVDTPDDLMDTPLTESAMHNNLEAVRWLIMQGARVNRKNLRGTTALHCAVMEGNFAIVKHLVENGALLHHRMFEGHSALHIVADQEHLDILEYLLMHGAVADVRTANGVTPLLHAVSQENIDIVSSLVKYGASVNGQDYFSHSPLSVAVSHNALHLVRYLIENGADVNVTTRLGIPLIESAEMQGYSDIVSVLRNVNSSTSERHSVLYLKLDSVTAQQELFKMCKTGQGSYKQIDELFRAGANANAADNFGRTPLIVATQNNCQQCVQWLLQANAKIFMKDKKSFTALEYAVINGNTNIVQLLLQQVGSGDKSSENAQDELQRALSLCIREKSNANVENMKMLLEYESYTASKRDSILELLEKSITTENVGIVELLFNYHLQCDSFEPGIVTIACQSKTVEILQHLSSFMYKSKHQSAYIKCAVRFCLANQFEEVLHIFETEPIFNTQDIFWTNANHVWFSADNIVFRKATEIAFRQGFNMNSPNEAGFTLLMFAAANGMEDIVQHLLMNKLSNFDLIGYNEDAFRMAIDGGHYKTASLFSEEPLVVTNISSILELHHSETDYNMMNSTITKHRLNIGTLEEDMKNLIYSAVIDNFARKPDSSVCLVKRTDEASIVVHLEEEENQSIFIDNLFTVPFIEYFDLKFVHNCKRASLLTMSSSSNMTVKRKDWLTFSTFLTPVMIMDILRQTDVTVLRSRQLKQQGMLWLTTNGFFEHPPYNHSVTDNEFKNASSKCSLFTVRALNKTKSVNVAVFLVPQDVLGAVLPKYHGLDYVYSGPDAVMLHRSVILIGLKTEKTDGKITDVNVSFQDQHSNFYHGAFVVESTEQNNSVQTFECSDTSSESHGTNSGKPFALPGSNGAAVVDEQSGIVFGLAVATTLGSCDSPFKHATFCLRLNYALESLNEVYNLGVGTLRTLET